MLFDQDRTCTCHLRGIELHLVHARHLITVLSRLPYTFIVYSWQGQPII